MSDRLYFREIKKDPSKSWYVGDQVIGRRNHQRVFHYAVPLTGKSGDFSGILLQQINLDEISSLHSDSGVKKSVRLLAFQGDGFLSFEHPYNPAAKTASAKDREFQNRLLMMARSGSNTSNIDTIESADGTGYYFGYNRANVFGLVAFAYIPIANVRMAFLEAQSTSLLVALIGWLIISYLFYRLYKETRATELAYATSLLDPLTNIHNRRALDEEFPRLWRNALRNHESIAVLFVDIDHFKRFNDMYGHEAGDSALLSVAKVLSNCIRRPLDFICRWGGEEFVVVLPNTDVAAALEVINCVMNDMRSMRIDVGASRQECLTVSIGLATTHVTEKNIDDDLIDMADKAMFNAKNAGRDCYKIYDQSSD